MGVAGRRQLTDTQRWRPMEVGEQSPGAGLKILMSAAQSRPSPPVFNYLAGGICSSIGGNRKSRREILEPCCP